VTSRPGPAVGAADPGPGRLDGQMPLPVDDLLAVDHHARHADQRGRAGTTVEDQRRPSHLAVVRSRKIAEGFGALVDPSAQHSGLNLPHAPMRRATYQLDAAGAAP